MARESREARLPETEDAGEESSGKKKSKFQTFKNFFAKKKKREPAADSEESGLKPSQSSSDVSLQEPSTTALHSATESGTKGNMGNKALSHDSVFISEPASENEAGDRLSQENIPANVKAVQDIRVGSPPQIITNGKSDDIGAVSEDDGLPRSPPEISSLHDILTSASSKSSNLVQRRSSLSLGGTDTEDEQVSSEASSRPVSPLSSVVLVSSASAATSELPTDFTVPANALACLDCSAARHRIALNPRKQRGLVIRNKQSLEQESEENVLSVSVSLEDETNLIKRLSTDQPKASCEGSVAQVVKKTDKDSPTAAETTDFTNNSDDMSSCENSVSPATDHDIVREEACSVDITNKNNVPLSLLYVQCNLMEKQKTDCNEENEVEEPKNQPNGSTSEYEPQQQPTRINIIELSNAVETGKEIICQGGSKEMAPNLLNTTSKEEATRAKEARTFLPRPMKQIEDEQCGSSVTTEERDEFLPCDNEKTLIMSTLHSLDDLQVQPLTLEASTEMKSIMQKELHLQVSETIPATKEDTVLQSQTSEAHDEPELILQTESDVGGSDLNQLLANRKISEELPLQRELQSSLPQGGSEDKYINPGAVSSSSSKQEAFVGIPNLNIESSGIVAASNEEEQLDILSPQAKSNKTNKAIEENMSRQKSTAKPVRFTIATAWQRSLSGGSSSKEEAHSRNLLAPAIKPELFEGIRNEDAEKERARTDIDKNDENTEFHSMKQAEMETQNAENPFGIRLRRTSSILKYSGESCTESQRAGSPPTYPSPPLPAREIQKSPGSVQPSNSVPASAKGVQEEKSPPKTKPEELPKKLHTSKPAEKVLNMAGTESVSEPAWVSMAKLKQKGFQGHPLAKQQTTGNRTVAGTDKQKRTSHIDEDILKKNLVSDPLRMEKSQLDLPVVSTAAAPAGLGSPTVTVAPVTEKEARLASSLPATHNNAAEPPWMSLAKKKHKAWREMPQSVQ